MMLSSERKLEILARQFLKGEEHLLESSHTAPTYTDPRRRTRCKNDALPTDPPAQMPEDADDGELALLVEEGVVGEHGEVDDQGRLRSRWPDGPL